MGEGGADIRVLCHYEYDCERGGAGVTTVEPTQRNYHPVLILRPRDG